MLRNKASEASHASRVCKFRPAVTEQAPASAIEQAGEQTVAWGKLWPWIAPVERAAAGTAAAAAAIEMEADADWP